MKKMSIRRMVVAFLLTTTLILSVLCIPVSALINNQTFRIVATYYSYWEHDVQDYEHSEGNGETHRAYAAVISNGKKLTNGVNNPYTDSFIRVEGYSGASPTIDISWRIEARTRYTSTSLNGHILKGGSKTLNGAQIYVSKNDTAYGPVQIPYDMNNIDQWQSIFNYIDLYLEGNLTAQVTANGTSTNGEIRIYGYN